MLIALYHAALGWEHALILKPDGAVCGSGWHTSGQGSSLPDAEKNSCSAPDRWRVCSLDARVKIRHLACGERHRCVLDPYQDCA